MLEKYYINGKKKPAEEQAIKCKSCKDGLIFLEEKFFKTQSFASDIEECICGICNTKYYIKREEVDKLINGKCEECPNLSEKGTDCENKDETFLCPGNEENIIKNVMNMEAKKVDIQTIQATEQFELLGLCPHSWVKSRPFRTGEGYFTIENCRVCRTGKVTYKGQVYEDNVMNLVTWLAHEGIKKIKQEAVTIKQFDNLGSIGDKEIGNLFEQTIPDLQFVSEPDFHFV